MRFILFCLFFGLLSPLAKAQQPFAVKKQRTIGSAWQQAIRHVYIPTSDAAAVAPQEKKSPEPVRYTPAPEPEPMPQHEQAYDQTYPQQALRQPSPEEMQQIFANLQAVLNSIDDEEYGDEDEDLEYADFQNIFT